ncbi:MAG: AAA family ATPase [Actinomycetota bacterium]
MDGYLEFINTQWRQARPRVKEAMAGRQPDVVTISRQAGSGSHVVAEPLLARLQAEAPKDECPWTIFDRNLVEKVLEDHDLPGRLAKFMPEDRKTEMSDTLDGLFGLQPSSWTLVRKTADTILHLAEVGNVILIGRGANIITSKLEHAFHVRLVGSLERRIAHLIEYKHLSLPEATAYTHTEDQGRKRYVKKYYGADIDDPLLYHLVINTDRVPYEEAARMIADAMLARRSSRSDGIRERAGVTG